MKWLWAGCVARSQSLCLYTCRQPYLPLASLMMSWGIRSQVSVSLCFSSSVQCFGFCVMSGCEVAKCMHLIAKVSMLNFIATYLQLCCKIFKITRVSIFGTQYILILLVCVTLTITGQPRNSVFIRRVYTEILNFNQNLSRETVSFSQNKPKTASYNQYMLLCWRDSFSWYDQ